MDTVDDMDGGYPFHHRVHLVHSGPQHRPGPLTCRLPMDRFQPWRCLWRGSLQITRTTPLRRMILQLRHTFFTEALTFISSLQTVRVAYRTYQGHLEKFKVPCGAKDAPPFSCTARATKMKEFAHRN